MALPEKDYYLLQDISDRWGIPLQDIRYYAEHGLLEIQTWLPDLIVKVFCNKRTEDGDIASVQVGVTSYKGYAIVEPDELRKIFRNSPRALDRFKDPESGELVKILDARAKFMVAIEDLVIRKCERDRFEREWDIEVVDTSRQIKISPPSPSFAGRPSVMHKIEQEFYARAASGILLPTLAGECRHLHAWAKATIKEEQTPSWRGIANALRVKYRHKNTTYADASSKSQMESAV